MFYSDLLRYLPGKLLKIQHSHIGQPLVPQMQITPLPRRSVRRGERNGSYPAETRKQSTK
jgi:hypothetical protein